MIKILALLPIMILSALLKGCSAKGFIYGP